EGADLLVEDRAVRAHQIALGNAVDAPVDRSLAVWIDADRRIGIAKFAEKAQRVVVAVLVVDADNGQPVILGQGFEDRVFLPARHAPGGEDVDEGEPAVDGSVGQGRYICTLQGGKRQ